MTPDESWAMMENGSDVGSMSYRSLADCVEDLKATGQLVEIDVEIDPHLEAAAIQRRVYQAEGPAILFRRVRNTPFPMVGNLFGTRERGRFLFRKTWDSVRRLVELKADPEAAKRQPLRYVGVPATAWKMLPRRVGSGPILAHQTQIDRLPQLKSWPDDGGAFVTLPLVYSEDPHRPGPTHSNLGMYRVQLSGGSYRPNQEVGLHYQIHRGIGVHHARALERGERLPVNVLVGGPPSLIFSAVMPLPEGLSELSFAGVLGGRRVALVTPRDEEGPNRLPIPAEIDFAICGTIDPETLRPEGPFGDHLGYYSLVHDFPVLQVERVYHRPGAIWPFTSVGRPPQEDTTFGDLIHELTGPLIPTVVPGVRAVNAVDAAGVHPLLLAIGSERYVPYAQTRRPQELLTAANAILGQGQMSLAKYLLIVAHEDDPDLDVRDIPAVLAHLLQRVDWAEDLHFQTRTTIDTLDYSGHGFNQGSKVVIAAAGPPRRELPTELPRDMTLPEEFPDARVALPGILAVRGPTFRPGAVERPHPDLERLANAIGPDHPLRPFPMIILVDDAEFVARQLNNLLWVTFTRSNPAVDISGVDPFTIHKHWGCRGPLLIDARIKPHHAPPLVDDPDIERRVDALGAPGGPLHGVY